MRCDAEVVLLRLLDVEPLEIRVGQNLIPLVNGSDVIDAGTDTGFPSAGVRLGVGSSQRGQSRVVSSISGGDSSSCPFLTAAASGPVRTKPSSSRATPSPSH